MKAKLVKESLDGHDYNRDNHDDEYKISELERIADQLNSEGFNVEVNFEETHAGIDHYAIIQRDYEDNASLAYMPKGFMASITDDDDDDSWGFILSDMTGEIDFEAFEDDADAALKAFREAIKANNREY